MTIIAAVSWSRQGGAPLNLAAQISRWTGDKVVAATIVERTWPPKADPIEDEYLRYVTSQASRSLDRVVGQLPGDLDIPGRSPIHFYSNGFARACRYAHNARIVVVRSSSSGCWAGWFWAV